MYIRLARVVLLQLILTLFAMRSYAGEGSPGAPQTQPTVPPPGVGIVEHLGEKVSVADLHFIDESGEFVSISKFIRPSHPIILTLVYYECPNLCNFLLSGLLTSLKSLDWTVGDQFDIVTLSINPRESSKLATQKTSVPR